MESTIRIKTDYTSPTRAPMVEIIFSDSEDPRDEMIGDFLDTVSHGSYMCIMEIGQHGQHYLKPISAHVADETLRKWWRDYNNKKEAEKNSQGQELATT